MPWGQFFTIIVQVLIALGIGAFAGFFGSAVVAAIREGMRRK